MQRVNNIEWKVTGILRLGRRSGTWSSSWRSIRKGKGLCSPL